jgi:hypothetical protein
VQNKKEQFAAFVLGSWKAADSVCVSRLVCDLHRGTGFVITGVEHGTAFEEKQGEVASAPGEPPAGPSGPSTNTEDVDWSAGVRPASRIGVPKPKRTPQRGASASEAVQQVAIDAVPSELERLVVSSLVDISDPVELEPLLPSGGATDESDGSSGQALDSDDDQDDHAENFEDGQVTPANIVEKGRRCYSVPQIQAALRCYMLTPQ